MEEPKFSRVKVEALLSVVSAKPIEPGKVHKLSFLDQAMGLHTAHLVFYYKSNPFKDGPMSSDIDNLRISLSRLLDQYPNVTGRLTRHPDGGWAVKCNDAGVRMVQACVGATLDEWLRSADAEEERDLTVWEDMPQDPSFWSPFRIQINHFKCGGLGIGLSCTHMEADLTSLTLFIKSWAVVHTGQPLIHPPIFHLPTFHTCSPQKNSTSTYTPSFPPAPPPSEMYTATFKFSSPTIEKYLSKIQNQCPNATPFDLLVALFCSCIARGRQPSQPSSYNISVCLDLRSRTSIVPYDYFGNAFHFSLLSNLEAEDLMNDSGLERMSNSIHRHVQEVLGLMESEDLLRSALEKEIREGGTYGPNLTCFNMEHMVEKGQPLMYDVEFEKGERPVHVSYNVRNVEGEGLIFVMPSDEGGLGRTVTVSLPEEEKIAKLCKDQRILDLEPTLLISGRRS